jgi:hypothetical protein
LPYTCTYASAPSPTSFTNTATASWSGSSTPDTSATGTATGDFSSVTPSIVDGSVTVTDPNSPNPPLPATVSYTDATPKTFTYSKTFTDPAGTCTTHPNRATFTATDNPKVTGSSSASVKVCVGANLIVSKTAAATYGSNIVKSVDKTKVEQANGTITFNYTVKVTTSGWVVSGGISVQNPNTWEDITANVGDVLSDSRLLHGHGRNWCSNCAQYNCNAAVHLQVQLSANCQQRHQYGHRELECSNILHSQ